MATQQGISVRERTQTVNATSRAMTIEVSRYLIIPGDDVSSGS